MFYNLIRRPSDYPTVYPRHNFFGTSLPSDAKNIHPYKSVYGGQALLMYGEQSKMPKRIVIFPQDVEVLTGRSSRFARQLLQKIRKSLGKKKGDLVTIREFSNYTKIAEGEIRDNLGV